MAYEQHINDLLWTTCELNESNIEWPVPALASVSRCAAQPELENPHASHDTLYTDIGCYDGNAGTSIGSVWTMFMILTCPYLTMPYILQQISTGSLKFSGCKTLMGCGNWNRLSFRPYQRRMQKLLRRAPTFSKAFHVEAFFVVANGKEAFFSRYE